MRQLGLYVGLTTLLACGSPESKQDSDTAAGADSAVSEETPSDSEDSQSAADTGGDTADTGGDTGDTGTDALEEPDPHRDPDSTFRSRLIGTGAGGTPTTGHCAISPAGEIYVTWQEDTDVYLARSTDGGDSFEAPVGIETGAATPMGWGGRARKPYVATDGRRVAVTYGTSGTVASYVVLSTSLDPLTFAAAVEVGSADRGDVEEFVKPVFSPSGSVWAVWHQTLGSSTGHDHHGSATEYVVVSREEDGWAHERVTGGDTPGEPCDCCPIDARVTAAGEVLVAYRNNIDNIRDNWVARQGASDTDFAAAVQGSRTGWEIYGCPVEGPRLAETSSGTQLMAWSDPTSGHSQVWVSQSEDGGQSWSGDRLVHASEDRQTRPTMVQADDGTIYMTVDVQSGPDQLFESTDGGATFSGIGSLSTPHGELEIPELCSGGGLTGLVGLTAAQELVWIGL